MHSRAHRLLVDSIYMSVCLTKIQWSNRNYQATEGMLCARTGERQLAQIASLLWQVERGGQLKSLRNHAWSQMLTPTVDFLLHLLYQLSFQSFNCVHMDYRHGLKLRHGCPRNLVRYYGT